MTRTARWSWLALVVLAGCAGGSSSPSSPPLTEVGGGLVPPPPLEGLTYHEQTTTCTDPATSCTLHQVRQGDEVIAQLERWSMDEWLARQEIPAWGAGEIDERNRWRRLGDAWVAERLWNLFDDCQHELVWARAGVVHIVTSAAPVPGCEGSEGWSDVPAVAESGEVRVAEALLQEVPPLLPVTDEALAREIHDAGGFTTYDLGDEREDAEVVLQHWLIPNLGTRFGWQQLRRDDRGLLHLVLEPPRGATPEALIESIGDRDIEVPAELAERGVKGVAFDWSFGLETAFVWVEDGKVHAVYDDEEAVDVGPYVTAYLDR